MAKYKVTFWKNGNKRIEEVDAADETAAMIVSYINYSCDDIIEIEKVIE